MMKSLFISTLFGCFILFSCSQQPKEKFIEFNVEGMVCNGCANTIQEELTSSKGVKDAEVSLMENKASIYFNPDSISQDELQASIEDLGYTIKE